ncbi:[methyl-Co(III) methanol-specific corrinoid protein]:coenzyme M methyltransferase [Anaerolineales bacterium]|nr:[methyl-Co(III) methanol-specific corrinoid protein]:coenzyme M methyltransferase [Anaerolineales bacterium]
MRQKILDLLSGKKVDSPPAFSGLIHVTAEGLQSEGLVFHEVHKDAQKMAKAAGSTFKLSGLPSASLPLDMYVEAEALGAEVNFREDMEFEFPLVRKAAFKSVKELTTENTEGTEILKKGRIKLVCEAIRLLKEDVGNDVVISGVIPGPYTLLLLVVEAGKMFVEMKKEPAAIIEALEHLVSLLAQVGVDYRDAGADFITIHDMGGSPAFIGPAKYEQFVLPAEKILIEKLPKPRVLSVCGNVTSSLSLLANAGADAVSIDQTVDLAAARSALKNTLLFGNIDPVQILYRGDEAKVAESVIGAKKAGVDAVWPGCDLIVQTPIQNIQSMKKA